MEFSWRDETLRMAAGGDAYLAHEAFEASNTLAAFEDFVAPAGRFELDYLGRPVVVQNEANVAPRVPMRYGA